MSDLPRVLVAGQPTRLAVPDPDPEWATVDDDGRTRFAPGLFSLAGRLVVVLPRCYATATPAGPETTLARVTLFVSSLARYAQERPTGRAVADPDQDAHDDAHDDALVRAGHPDDLIDQVEAALLLWRDHVVNGPFAISSPRVHDQLPGRVLWTQALRHGAPVESRSGLVFRRLPKTSVRPNPRHELVTLYAATCAEIGRRYGLRAGPAPPPISRADALDRIERGERVCFADRPRRLLGLLRRYHAHRQAEGQDHHQLRGLFARNYAYVWERMLQVALGHDGRGQHFTGTYRLPDHTRLKGLDLRPDLVTPSRLPTGRQVLLVLDAKDYAPDAWPRSADLSKQILYRLLLSNLIDATGLPLEDIGNAFLFPALVPDHVSRRGVHHLDGNPIAGTPGRVVGLNVDLEQVTEAYLSGRAVAGLRAGIAKALFR